MGDPLQSERAASRLDDILVAADPKALRQHIISLFAAIRRDGYRNNPIARYEGDCASEAC